MPPTSLANITFVTTVTNSLIGDSLHRSPFSLLISTCPSLQSALARNVERSEKRENSMITEKLLERPNFGMELTWAETSNVEKRTLLLNCFSCTRYITDISLWLTVLWLLVQRSQKNLVDFTKEWSCQASSWADRLDDSYNSPTSYNNSRYATF